MSKKFLGVVGALLMVLASSLLVTSGVSAETLQSNNFRFDESTLGAGGLIQSSSTNYQGGNSLGDIAVGDSASASYQVTSPSRNSDDPSLKVAINTTSANFGSFSPASSSVTTASFSVSNYTSYGYVVQLAGSTLTNGARTIPALATETSPQIGTEQFGVNLVANTDPTSVGANPVHGLFGVGSAAASYSTPNKYRFVSGETIATAPSSSGETTYTLTYMANVAGLTQGGIYKSSQTLIVTGTY